MTTSLEPVARAVCAARGLTFVDCVGAGTFKETFRASGPQGDVALKVYRSPASMGRAQREIQAMLACDHPNIAKLQLVDNINLQGVWHVFCLEEFLAGGTLAQLPRSHWADSAETRRVVRQLADAVRHIADRALVHRDLKPENIMLRSDRQTPVIVDFGIVRNLAMPSMTPTWAQQGPCTPYFASAEQLANEKLLIDWRSDQFSLGVTFSVLVLGRHPYERSGDDQPAVIQRVGRREAPAQEFVAAVRQLNLTPLERMVAPWPAGRYRKPADLVSAWT